MIYLRVDLVIVVCLGKTYVFIELEQKSRDPGRQCERGA